MFTIKHIAWGGAAEILHETDQVRVSRAESFDNSFGSGDLRSIEFEDGRGDVQTITEGLVYVTNDVGKTIAKYEFCSSKKAKDRSEKYESEGVWSGGG